MSVNSKTCREELNFYCRNATLKKLSRFPSLFFLFAVSSSAFLFIFLENNLLYVILFLAFFFVLHIVSPLLLVVVYIFRFARVGFFSLLLDFVNICFFNSPSHLEFFRRFCSNSFPSQLSFFPFFFFLFYAVDICFTHTYIHYQKSTVESPPYPCFTFLLLNGGELALFRNHITIICPHSK
jgi:hypothetical protein